MTVDAVINHVVGCLEVLLKSAEKSKMKNDRQPIDSIVIEVKSMIQALKSLDTDIPDLHKLLNINIVDCWHKLDDLHLDNRFKEKVLLSAKTISDDFAVQAEEVLTQLKEIWEKEIPRHM